MSAFANTQQLSGNQHRWHYEFAHLALRVPVFGQADFILDALADPLRSQALIRAAMARVAQNCGLSEDQVETLARQIRVLPARFGADSGFVVGMPPPQNAPDCYLFAIVRDNSGSIAYYTLERSISEGSTMLCGWNAEGAHLNFGPGPKPDLDAFVAAIVALRQKS